MNFYKLKSAGASISGVMLSPRYSKQRIGNSKTEIETLVPQEYEFDFNGGHARKWTDFIDSLDGPLWSNRTVKAFQEANLTGVEFFQQTPRKIDSKWLQKAPYPGYNLAHATSGVPAIPYHYKTGEELPKDPTTGLYDLRSSNVRRWRFDFGKWNGADLFYISTVYTMHRYCTQRLKDLVKENGFTNFDFTPAINEDGDEFFNT